MKTQALLKNSTIVRSFEESLLPVAFQLGSLLLPETTIRALEKIFLTPKRYEAPKIERDFLATGQALKIPFRDSSLAAWSWGDGPTVVLMHGWSGRGGQMHSFVTPLVEAGFSVVVVDGPAHGASPGTQTSMIDFAAAIWAVADRAWPVHAIIGHSLGGSATALALLEGLRVDRVILIGSPSDPSDYATQVASQFGISEAITEKVKARIERRYNKSWSDLILPNRVNRITTPALFFHDLNDQEVSVTHGEKISQAWPHSQLIVTHGLGHRRILKDSEVIRKSIDFLLKSNSIS